MLWSDDGSDYIGKIVYVGEGFNAEEHVIEGGLLTCRLFGGLNNCKVVSKSQSIRTEAVFYHSVA